jgi:hypothetical protein
MTRTFARLTWMLLVCLGTLALAGGAQAASTIVLPRAGQVGFSGQAMAGTMAQTGSLGTDFGSGYGGAFRLRYRMRYERAMGLSFEAQNFDARESKLGALPADTVASNYIEKTTLQLAGLDIYQMFGTRTRTTKMLSAGIGIAQTSVKMTDGELSYPGDGFYLSVGAGLEHFFYRSWAFDFSTRYNAVFVNSEVNHDVQVQVGLIGYASF